MSDKNIQSSPFAMKHSASRHKKGGGKGRTLTRPQFGQKGSSKGFGHFGAQSYGGKGK
jgi:hypothetical protein